MRRVPGLHYAPINFNILRKVIMLNALPNICIITPCLNREKYIREAIESVKLQNYPEFEHIITDGGSTDQTLRILFEYPHLKIVSGPDQGMYDALNKGLELAKGEIIGFLNSDDFYEPNIFKLVVEQFAAYPEVDVVTGGATYFKNGQIVEQLPAVNLKAIAERVTTGAPIINAWFFRRKVFEQIGKFDESFAISADRDFLIRCYLNQVNLHSCDTTFYHYREHAGSLTVNRNLEFKQKYMLEHLIMIDKNIRMATSESIQKLFLKWRDITYFELVLLELRRKRPFDAFRFLLAAIKLNPGWGLIAMAQTFRLIKNYIGRRLLPQHVF
jgi:glycosyltransferase involved in cell wall biosynthesis